MNTHSKLWHTKYQSKIEEIYNKDLLKTLEELWEIKPKVENLDEKTIKWNNIRETCDSFDIEMKNKMFRK
jgi:hypothetical protein